MSFERAAKIADAVLLEGYVLYPYRACSTKNQYRWTFGVVAPREWSEGGGSDPWWLEAQVLLTGSSPRVRGRLRFLRVVDRRVEALRDGRFVPTDRLEVGTAIWSSWEEGETVEIDFEARASGLVPVYLPASAVVEVLRDSAGNTVGRILRQRAALDGVLRTSVVVARRADLASARDRVARVSVRLENLTPAPLAADEASRRQIMKSSFASTHLLLSAEGGSFVSAIDPPPELEGEVAACRNVGTFPALVGAGRSQDLVLCAPIVLGDRPQVAPESKGDLFDACEIDEILALRTRTLTPNEKALARATDPRAAAVVDRVDGFSEATMSELHGAIRERRVIPEIGPGSRVRILPPMSAIPRSGAPPTFGGAATHRRTDAQDLLYAGSFARVESVFEDVDGTEYLALTIEGDPAAELHRWYGRFHYYRFDEVELVPPEPEESER